MPTKNVDFMPGRRDDDAIFESNSLPIHELICVAKIFVRTKYARIFHRWRYRYYLLRSKSTNRKTIATLQCNIWNRKYPTHHNYYMWCKKYRPHKVRAIKSINRLHAKPSIIARVNRHWLAVNPLGSIPAWRYPRIHIRTTIRRTTPYIPG